MAGKNLFICFDAFGTLFAPKRPVVQQYAEVARSLGLSGFSDERLGAAFKNAYKHESAQNPNYGHATGLGSEKWWTNIIRNTFKEVIPPTQTLPQELVPKLLHRFWSNEGYDLLPDVQSLLRKIREHATTNKHRVVIGVITNSDDRVPDILRSLSLRVSSVRFGSQHPSIENASNSKNDIDFVVMSYDVGFEKPDRRIFDAAVQTLESLVVNKKDCPLESWQKIYVGDEHAKDVVGAVGAGWKAILVDREGLARHADLLAPEENDKRMLSELFRASQALFFPSLKRLEQHI